jgi:hypothetical protein
LGPKAYNSKQNILKAAGNSLPAPQMPRLHTTPADANNFECCYFHPETYLLEAPLQRRVLFNVLAVLIQCGGANAAQLTTSQLRLQQVA